MSAKLSLEIAHTRNDHYDAHTKLLWRCEKSHIWEASPQSILRGHQGRYCSGTAKLNIEIAKQIALSKQDQCTVFF
ncbi:4847_t:CDS:2 [Diversispora eburnea]|uniref:4847_t:CDS:1 n=1 Tax=Diversispora eburnea TaxID=1213867 RepID=A0A9N8WT36_9GLOM|nr:4847_t:CDS:2 [Diversispora eburnea]